MKGGKNDHPIICFGEYLWDDLPSGRLPGGAPMNVAYHLQRLGQRAIPVTAVGNDEPGHALLQLLRDRGLDATYVAIHDDLPTGVVTVTLDADGSASYDIVEGVAWDRIEVSDKLLATAANADALVYGTLAGRNAHNMESLLKLLEAARSALRVLDVNLRAPYDAHQRVWQLAERSTLIKMNDSEAEQLSGSNDPQQGARLIAERSGCERVCITCGARGAGILYDDEWIYAEGEPVNVRDTVGAGDAFLAGLVDGLLRADRTPRQALEQACRLGEFVAARMGATPEYAIDDVELE